MRWHHTRKGGSLFDSITQSIIRQIRYSLQQDLEDYLSLFLDRIYRICWIFSLGRSPEESVQTPIASGE